MFKLPEIESNTQVSTVELNKCSLCLHIYLSKNSEAVCNLYEYKITQNLQDLCCDEDSFEPIGDLDVEYFED